MLLLYYLVAISAVARFPFGDCPRSEARHTEPEMHGAPPAARKYNASAFDEATPKDKAALPPAALGRPVTDVAVLQIRKSRWGHCCSRGTVGALASIPNMHHETVDPLKHEPGFVLSVLKKHSMVWHGA